MLSAVLDIVPVVFAQIPDPGGGQPPPGADQLTTILRWAAWIAFAIGVLGFLVAGAMMTVSARRGEGGEHASRLGWVMAGCVVISSSSGIVNALV